ncbi:Uncharacterized protein PRO82_002024 [Candidatus Protochlamydia amoebophila]|nr:Uncharacterized protein [Candidatus Protochlamydia amoebophila]
MDIQGSQGSEILFLTENGPLIPLILIAVGILLIIFPYWFIFSKAGFSKWLSLLMIIPGLNFILLYFIALSKWPALKKND